MRMKSFVLAAALAVALPVAALAQAVPPTTPIDMPDAITGTMTIDFGTRTNRDANDVPNEGARDVYTANMTILNSFLFQGDVTRQPWLPGSIMGGTRQQGFLQFNINTSLRNPANPAQVAILGGWVGGMQLDGAGKYLLSVPPDGSNPLRFSIQAGNSFVSNFGGEIQGRKPRQGGLAALVEGATNYVNRTYTRVVNGQQVQVTVAGADPMSFTNVVMGAGPLEVYPETTINGSIDYDPETGNWFLDAFASYTSGGVVYNDHYTGTIRWVEDLNREANGLGYYELNVRINEPPADEAAVFAPTTTMTAEEAFFAMMTTVPGFTGTVSYQDTFRGESVIRSVVTYDVDANQASRIQTMNFAKLLFLIIGPFNDE